MRFTQIVTILAVAVAGVVAAPGGHSPPPPPPPPPPPAKPTSIVQQITCSGNSSPFCCSTNEAFGNGEYVCTAIVAGSSVNCNGVTICCNNNDGDQSCSNALGGPVTYTGY